MKRKIIAVIAIALVLFSSLVLTNIGSSNRQNIAEETTPGVLSIVQVKA